MPIARRSPAAASRARPRTLPAILVLGVAVLLPCHGCAKLKSWKGADDVRPERIGRAQAAAKSFDLQREQGEYQSALACWQQEDFQGCRQTLQRLLARNPDHRDARLMMAELCMLASQPGEAQNHLDHALAGHPDDPRVQHAMAMLLDAQDQGEAALGHYQRAAELAPHDQAYAASYRSALASSRRGPPPGTAVRASHADAATPIPALPPQARLWLDEADRALAARAIDQARQSIQRAIAADPRNPQARLSASVLALRHDELELAIELARTGCAAFPDSAALHRVLGAAHYRLGDLAASQVALTQALYLDNADPLSYFLLGSTLARLGQADSAEWHYRQARRLDPRYARVR
jgi:predicted Zn-dependent protease